MLNPQNQNAVHQDAPKIREITFNLKIINDLMGHLEAFENGKFLFALEAPHSILSSYEAVNEIFMKYFCIQLHVNNKEVV